MTGEAFFVPPGESPWRAKFERLRHEVFCVQHGYEPRAPDGRERDAFDSCATYVVLAEGGRIVGGCRLIPHLSSSRHAIGTALPMFASGELPSSVRLPCAEISRMILTLKAARCRSQFYRGIFNALSALGVRYAYAAVEPFYRTLLERELSGEVITQVGEERSFVTPTGKTLCHVLIEVDSGAWASRLSDSRKLEYAIVA